jgi:hypothetical protein
MEKGHCLQKQVPFEEQRAFAPFLENRRGLTLAP